MRVPPDHRPRPMASPSGALLQARRVMEGLTLEDIARADGRWHPEALRHIEAARVVGASTIVRYHNARRAALAARDAS